MPFCDYSSQPKRPCTKDPYLYHERFDFFFLLGEYLCISLIFASNPLSWKLCGRRDVEVGYSFRGDYRLKF